MKNVFLVLVIGLSLFAGCSREDDTEGLSTLSVDLSKTEDLLLSNGKILNIETSDSSLLYSYANILKSDGRLFIHSRDLLKIFDPVTGKYLGRLGRKGNGPAEYASINQVWMEGDTVRLFDFNTRSVLSFKPDGTFISKVNPYLGDNSRTNDLKFPVYVMKYPDSSGYIGLNCFTDGTTETNPTASFYDNDLGFVSDIRGRELREGGNLNDRMSADLENGRMLMWEGLKDTLFTVTKTDIRPLYAFDFGKNRFPPEYQNLPELFGRAQKFREGKDVPYASAMHCFQKQGDRIFFSFSTSDERFFLGMIDIGNKTVRTFRLVSPYGRFSQSSYMTMMDGSLYISLTDGDSPESNQPLFIIPTNYFD
ncbi:MAG: 6-bladed beta-propeller [Muribaculaceae bacterium]|nr:6-bladed beta-propeller [Muribaculaceae bacterium]